MGNLPGITSGAIRLSQNLEHANDILRNLSLKEQDIQISIFQESKETIGAGSGRKGLKWERRPDMGVYKYTRKKGTVYFVDYYFKEKRLREQVRPNKKEAQEYLGKKLK